MKAIRPAAAIPSIVIASLFGLLLAGCGNFWQAPNGSTGTGTTATTTTLSASNSSVSAGASVTLTATVSASAATGTVTFYSNGSSIGSSALSSGTASLSPTFSTAGTDSLTAKYGGDSTYAASTSSAITLTVTAAAAASLPALSRSANLVLDPETAWTPSASVHLHNVADVVASGSTVMNIDGSGHCVFYSGSVYLSGDAQGPSAHSNPSGVYELSGGGVLAPEGTTELDCE